MKSPDAGPGLDMDGWLIALLLKGVALVSLAFGYYVVVYKGSYLIGRFIPNGKFKDFLFRERGRTGTGTGRELQ
jgi:hypothetical protein